MYGKTVTIFNYYESATTGEAYWYPHVLSGVDLNTDRGAILGKYGFDTSDNAQLHIPFIVIQGKKAIIENEKKPSANGTIKNVSALKDTTGNDIVGSSRNTIETIYNSKTIAIPYLAEKEWARQTNDSLSSTITFSEECFFWEGDWDCGIIKDSNYKRGFYQYMNSQKDNVFKITSVGGPYALIPHFEILAK